MRIWSGCVPSGEKSTCKGPEMDWSLVSPCLEQLESHIHVFK